MRRKKGGKISLKLRVKRILKYLAPVPFVLLVICTAYFVKPLIQNAADRDTDTTADPVTEVPDTVHTAMPESGETGREDQSEAIPPAALQETENSTGEGVEAGRPEEESGEDVEEGNPDEEQGEDSLLSETRLPETEDQPEVIAAVTSDPVMLHDLYAERGERVTFPCFRDGAESYAWEYYDMTIRDWAEMEGVSGYDDLGRQISCAVVEASEENDGLMLRCKISLPEGEVITETACLYVFDKGIAGITLEDISTDAETYVSSRMIPVIVEYADGTTEEITGLSGLHFLQEVEQSVEESETLSGNCVEIITTAIAEVDYLYPEYGENQVRLRYHPRGLNAKKMDAGMIFYGTDQNPPVISQVDFSDYTIGTDEDDQAEIMVTVMAEDDITPYPLLQYAVLPEGQEAAEADWHNRNCFNAVFDQNGTWVVYCRDQYGNVGSYEKDIIVSDHEAPEILSVTLEKDGWQTANTIQVEASDDLSVTYSYSCAETGEDSGFIGRNYYEITHNGTWTVRVRDAAGNVSSEQIHVTSIDSQVPVILGITTQQNNREVQ